MAFTVPGGQNTFVPTTELSGNLLVAFGRNVKDFPVNKIARHRSVSKTEGLYTYFNPLDLARFSAGMDGTISKQFDWPAGSPAPTGFTNTLGFEFRPFSTRRKAYPCNLDQLGVDQASWPVLKSNTEAAAQLAMTDRALEVSAIVTTASTYPSTHVDTATVFGGGFLDDGTATNPILKRALQTLALRIQKDSAGNVKRKNLTIVMNPTTALALSLSAEIHAVMIESRFAVDLVKGDGEMYETYGLPPRLYGFKVVVEDTTYNPSNRGDASEAQTFVFPDNLIAMVSREEDFESAEGTNSYSTVHLFTYGPDDMKVESETDTWNRIIKMRVVDNRAAVAVAGVTGGLITAVLS